MGSKVVRTGWRYEVGALMNGVAPVRGVLGELASPLCAPPWENNEKSVVCSRAGPHQNPPDHAHAL